MKSPQTFFKLGLACLFFLLIQILGSTPNIAAQKPTTVLEMGGIVQNLNSDMVGRMHAAGLTWVKQFVSVGNSNASTSIKVAKDAGFKVLLTVGGNPTDPLDPTYLDRYGDFAAGLATAGADAIEIWRGMNSQSSWSKIDPTTYVLLLQNAYKKIKAANSKTIVISGALLPTGIAGPTGKTDFVWNDDVYYAAMATAKASQFLDCVGVEYLQGSLSPTKTSGDPRGTDPTFYFNSMLNRALKLFSGKPACFTSLGYLSLEGIKLDQGIAGAFSWAKNVTAKQQAQWLAEATALSVKSGKVRLVIIFNVDFTGNNMDPSGGYAIIRPDGTCPACDTLAKVLPPAKTPVPTAAATSKH